ncbi:MAG: hypothetical protein AAFV26_03230, partial [Pseudomonadota bacterium]
VSRTRRAVIMTLPPKCDLAQAGDFITSHLDRCRQPADIKFDSTLRAPRADVTHGCPHHRSPPGPPSGQNVFQPSR